MPGDDPLKKRIVTFDQEAQIAELKTRYRSVMAENTVFKGCLMALAKAGEGHRIEVDMSNLGLKDFREAELEFQPVGNKVIFQYLTAADAARADSAARIAEMEEYRDATHPADPTPA
jgi:hypothetical protein